MIDVENFLTVDPDSGNPMSIVEYDGMRVFVYRDSSGALRIDTETTNVNWKDEHRGGVPKLRLKVNTAPILQMNSVGHWEVGDGYPDETVLDRIVEEVSE